MAPLQQSDAVASAQKSPALYQRIGEFLVAQRIEPSPANYAIAYAVVTETDSALAQEVAARTDGGVRLTQRDLDELGMKVEHSQLAADSQQVTEAAELLAARAQAQMDGFTDVVVRMHTQARDFGRELIASADAIERSRAEQGASPPFVEDVSRITAAMIARVREAERRLEEAHREAEELRRALEAARGDALSDPLTGLPNRRAFEETYAERIAAGQTPCVAVCDVDHFKHVNDRFGHTVGDRVLCAISAALSEACAGHFVARHGGEEFAILFDGSIADAVAVIEEARINIGRKRFRLRESDVLIGTVTFSTGISLALANEPLAKVFERADALLYAAKASGRDCIFVDGDVSI